MICINHEGAQLRVAELGGELRGYRDAAGTEYLWSGDPAVWKGVSPVLFPAIGALRDGGASIAGVRYPVPRHEMCIRDSVTAVARYPPAKRYTADSSAMAVTHQA